MRRAFAFKLPGNCPSFGDIVPRKKSIMFNMFTNNTRIDHYLTTNTMEFQWCCCYRIHNTNMLPNEWFNQPTSNKIPKGHIIHLNIFDKLQLNFRSWVFENNYKYRRSQIDQIRSTDLIVTNISSLFTNLSLLIKNIRKYF